MSKSANHASGEIAPRYGWLLLLPLALSFLGGCQHTQQTRAQMAEDDGRPEIYKEVPTISEVTEVSNAGPLQVSGVGLVTGLEGTGGTPPGEFRKMLEIELRKQSVERVNDWLDSPDSALVLVSAIIPPGARKGDPLDIEVTLPQGSKATSLRGGVLQFCSLRNYETSKNINPNYDGANKLLQGHVLAVARGPLLIGSATDESSATPTRARVWHGGVTLVDRPFFLVLKNDRRFASVAASVARRINLMFPADSARQQRIQESKRLLVLGEMHHQLNEAFKAPPLARVETAKAVPPDMITLRVPYAYRLNPERYLRVALLIPFQEPDKQIKYRQELRRLLQQPEHTVVAALRLEALGKESLPALTDGLRHEHPLVRFASAEALAYLELQTGVDELARLAEQHDALRAYCLTALASLEEGSAQLKLVDLLHSHNAEMRYGAFRALRMQDDPVAMVQGDLLNGSFWLHRVAPKSSPLIHVTANQRAEIVLFGEEARLFPPFQILAGEFVLTAEPHDDRCTVSRFVVGGPNTGYGRKQCSFRMEDVLRTMAEMGGHYQDAVEVVRQADHAKVMTAPMLVDAMPITVPVEELAREGKERKWLIEGASTSANSPRGVIQAFEPDRFLAVPENRPVQQTGQVERR